MVAGERVALRSDPSWIGRVVEDKGGVVSVAGDGWEARLPVDALVVVAEDKSWPPSGIEHK